MKSKLFTRMLMVAALVALSGCSTVQAQPAPDNSGGVLSVFINDFTAAQNRYLAAAAAQPAGSALAATFTADAACLSNAVQQFQTAQAALTAPQTTPAGIVDLGASIDINVALLQAQIAAAQSSQTSGIAACDALVGSLVRKTATSVNQLLSPAVIKKVLGL